MSKNKRWDDPSKPDVELPDLLGSVRRHPDGTVLAVLWPSPPHPARWMVTDKWGSLGYERNRAVADWPIVGAVPFSPAAGVELATPTSSGAPSKRYRITDEHLKRAVEVYVEAEEQGKPPTQAVATHFNVAHSTAAKWMGHARARSILSRWTAADSVRTGLEYRTAAQMAKAGGSDGR